MFFVRFLGIGNHAPGFNWLNFAEYTKISSEILDIVVKIRPVEFR